MRQPTPPKVALFVSALAVFLVGTGNGIVRLALSSIQTGLLEEERHLRGGRIIGPLERLLIFGLGVAGQLTAVGLVVAAKSLLRITELREGQSAHQSGATAQAETRAEYLLVGSLLSWAVALAAVGITSLTGAA